MEFRVIGAQVGVGGAALHGESGVEVVFWQSNALSLFSLRGGVVKCGTVRN